MKELFSLKEKSLPLSFSPHDFVIRNVEITDEYLTFTFENDITYHDGIRELFPGMRSLILRFHLTDREIGAYRWKKNRFFPKKEGYRGFDVGKLPSLCGGSFTYLKHYLSYCGVIIYLAAPDPIFLDVTADTAEYEWIEA